MFENFLEKVRSRKMTRQKEQEQKNKTGKENQTTALRFQTGDGHQTSWPPFRV